MVLVLVDRTVEAEAIERVLAAARDGLSAVLVLRGESGIGKTALLDHAVENASDLQVARSPESSRKWISGSPACTNC